MSEKLTLGISGEIGSFSEEAAWIYEKRIAKEFSPKFLIDMENVLASVDKEEVSYGIFPVANLRGGLVKMAFDAMGKYPFQFVDEIWLDVHQTLLALPGKKIKDIIKVVSHPQAFAQCDRYLRTKFKQAELIEWGDTAKAAKDLMEGKLDENTAVIAPERSANLYHLEILEKNIQDNKPNLTVFIVVKK